MLGHTAVPSRPKRRSLAVTLHHLATGTKGQNLTYFSGTTETTVSKYLLFGLMTLFDALSTIPEARVDFPPINEAPCCTLLLPCS